MEKISDLSNRFLTAINKLGISGYRLSKEIPEISQSTLTHIKSGRNEPSKTVMDLFLKKYPEISAGWLLTGEGAMLKTDMNEAKPVNDLMYQNIPFVPIHAQAGYTKGYGDQEYIDQLPTIPVIVDKNYKGKYRVFEVEGDSMDDGSRNSLCEGDKILCREVKQELWTCKLHFKDWYFVMAMKNDGILVKQITEHEVENGIIHCHSLNPLFEDFEINLRDVAELYNVIKIVDRNTRI
jgi:phage repressor protein C with HTH and peptisase S24 domain